MCHWIVKLDMSALYKNVNLGAPERKFKSYKLIFLKNKMIIYKISELKNQSQVGRWNKTIND